MAYRLNDHRFYILAGLTLKPLHGYGLISEIEKLSEGRFRPRSGALYSALEALIKAGLIATGNEEVVNGRLRKYYKLTAKGNDVLAAEALVRKKSAEATMLRLGIA